MIKKSDFDLSQQPELIAQIESGYNEFRTIEAGLIDKMSDRYSAPGLMISRSCPLCSTDSAADLFRKGSLLIVQCNICGMQYSKTVLREDLDRNHYEADPTSNVASLARIRRNPAYRKLDLCRAAYVIEQLQVLGFPAHGSLLDVGTGHGAIVEVGHERGIAAEGIELSPVMAEDCQQRGLNVRSGAFPEAVAPEIRYDAIVMLDVLEHMVEPRDILRDLRRHLLPHGLLGIQVPNMESLQILLEGPDSSNYCHGHWSYFTPKTLRRLLSENGFEVLRLETYISEMNRIRRHPPEAIRSILGKLGFGDLDAETLNPNVVMEKMLGYKLFAVARPLP